MKCKITSGLFFKSFNSKMRLTVQVNHLCRVILILVSRQFEF